MSDSGLTPSEHNLVWIDLEMTGLLPGSDRIIEIAVVVTDPQITVRVEGPVFAVHQSDAVLDGMDNWNRGTHGKSGLTERVRASTVDEAAAEAQVIAFLSQFVPKGKSPRCGNSICQDRRFLANYMPALEAGRAGRFQEGAGAHRAGRHPRVDRRDAALPPALAVGLTSNER